MRTSPRRSASSSGSLIDDGESCSSRRRRDHASCYSNLRCGASARQAHSPQPSGANLPVLATIYAGRALFMRSHLSRTLSQRKESPSHITEHSPPVPRKGTASNDLDSFIVVHDGFHTMLARPSPVTILDDLEITIVWMLHHKEIKHLPDVRCFSFSPAQDRVSNSVRLTSCFVRPRKSPVKVVPHYPAARLQQLVYQEKATAQLHPVLSAVVND